MQTVFFDVGMLVMSEGQERTAPEYRALLRKHKFSNVIIKFLPKAMYRDAILARKDWNGWKGGVQSKGAIVHTKTESLCERKRINGQ